MYMDPAGDHVRAFFCMKDIHRYKMTEHSLSQDKEVCGCLLYTSRCV